jgi:hypothetical protein
MKASTLARVGLLHAAAAEYIWPSKLDLMEDLLYLQTYMGKSLNNVIADSYNVIALWRKPL